ncbi:hypothetical protein BC332_28252 [Capsicum chinense]|nr:hypothetical protein BC332_28252 [Capsicum chinense]
MDGLGEQNTALQMKPRSMVEEEVPAGEVAAQAQREIERLLQDNQKEWAGLAESRKMIVRQQGSLSVSRPYLRNFQSCRRRRSLPYQIERGSISKLELQISLFPLV